MDCDVNLSHFPLAARFNVSCKMLFPLVWVYPNTENKREEGSHQTPP